MVLKADQECPECEQFCMPLTLIHKTHSPKKNYFPPKLLMSESVLSITNDGLIGHMDTKGCYSVLSHHMQVCAWSDTPHCKVKGLFLLLCGYPTCTTDWQSRTQCIFMPTPALNGMHNCVIATIIPHMKPH